MINEKAGVYADRDWWQAIGDVFGLELRGWTYRDTSVFADRETERRVEIPGWLAERILAYESAKPKEEDWWRDIASAPPLMDGREILLYGPGVLISDGRTSTYGKGQHVGFADHEGGMFPTRDPKVFCRASHWRPLPEPPSAMLSAAGER